MQSNAKHSVVSRTHVDALAGALDRLEKEWACWLRPEAAAANVHSTQQAQMAKKARERVFEEDRFRDKLRQSSIRDAGSRAMVLMKLEEAGRHSPAAAQVRPQMVRCTLVCCTLVWLLYCFVGGRLIGQCSTVHIIAWYICCHGDGNLLPTGLRQGMY